MLVVRLKRIGKKNKPAYRIVVAEHSSAVNGPFVEDLGFYNPHTKTFSIDKEAVTGWMNKGAKPSNTVARLLEKEKIKHKSIVVIKYNKAPKKKVEEKAAPVAKPETADESSETPVEGETTEEANPPAGGPTETAEEVTATEKETPTEEPTEEVAGTGESSDLSSEALAKEEEPAA